MQNTKLKTPEINIPERSKNFYIPKRYVFVLLAGFGIFNAYAMRVNLSVAMVAMVNNTANSHVNPNSSSSRIVECPSLIHSESKSDGNKGFKGHQYDWDARTQGRILGSFFYGYLCTLVPGGILSQKFGVKWFFGGGLFLTSILTLMTPLAADWSTSALIIIRIFEGLGEGASYPAITLALSTWSPILERSRISVLIHIGSFLGNIVSMPVSGWLCSTDLLAGWPSVFYVFGTLGCIWFACWCFLMYEKPSEHPSISKEELLYIEQNKDLRKSGIPWKSIFTSVPVWALVFAQFGNTFGFYVLLTEMPTYLSTILHFDIKSNGLLSSVPFMALSVFSFIASFLADNLRERGTMSITNIRKLFNSVGFFGPAICLIGVSQAGCRPELTVALLSFAMALNGFAFSGFNVTHVDMCPSCAGTLYSIAATLANINGILAPMIVGIFTAHGATLSNWSYVFYIAAAGYTVFGIIFAIFSSAELQPWDLVKEDAEEMNIFHLKTKMDEEMIVNKF